MPRLKARLAYRPGLILACVIICLFLCQGRTLPKYLNCILRQDATYHCGDVISLSLSLSLYLSLSLALEAIYIPFSLSHAPLQYKLV